MKYLTGIQDILRIILPASFMFGFALISVLVLSNLYPIEAIRFWALCALGCNGVALCLYLALWDIEHRQVQKNKKEFDKKYQFFSVQPIDID